MFGYIRPYKPELKMKEFEQFKACYCALCHSLTENYGKFSSLFLSYDFVYLAMLLWQENENPEYTSERCLASPLCKKLCCKRNKALDIAAGCSVILTYWKLKDSAEDEKFFKASFSGICAALFKRVYRKAANRFPEFDRKVRENLSELSDLEKLGSTSIDKTADKFALILAAASDFCSDSKKRILYQLLYHTGRWIYISDAVNDLAEDMDAKRYNPVAARFSLGKPILEPDYTEWLKTTLIHSVNDISAAFALLAPGPWSGILMNIIYLGMPDTTDKVFTGELKDINRVFPRNKDFRR